MVQPKNHLNNCTVNSRLSRFGVRLMNPHEIVLHEVDRERVNVIFQLLREKRFSASGAIGGPP
jgi:hypothetical protein